jgi:hypothetical protein
LIGCVRSCFKVVLRRSNVVGADTICAARQPEYASTREQAPAAVRRFGPTHRTAPKDNGGRDIGDTASANIIDPYLRVPAQP